MVTELDPVGASIFFVLIILAQLRCLPCHLVTHSVWSTGQLCCDGKAGQLFPPRCPLPQTISIIRLTEPARV